MARTPGTISTADLAGLRSDPRTRIVDLRPVEAFNGWALHKELRGGHIEDAISFPLAWTKYQFEMPELLEQKRLSPEDQIILYSYDPSECARMSEMLRSAGYRQALCYHRFLDEWAPDHALPMDRLRRYHRLVYPEWVKQLIDGQQPPHYDGRGFVICHSHYDYIDDYHNGHIPGAIALDTNALESPETWNRRSPAELRAALETHGIDCDTTVIMYGRYSSPDNDDPFPGRAAGHLGAIRSAAIMMYAGVKDVRVLNGGMTKWMDAGLPVSTEAVAPTPIADFGAPIPGHPELFIDTPEARDYLAAPDAELVCVRSWEELIGKVSGYNYIEKKGRIPGAVFANCGSDAYHMENYRNLDYTTRDFHDIAAAWAEVGITPKKRCAFYCGTGWRGSEAFFNAYLMGWPHAAVYDGGWFEWSSDPANPTATGEPSANELRNADAAAITPAPAQDLRSSTVPRA